MSKDCKGYEVGESVKITTETRDKLIALKQKTHIPIKHLMEEAVNMLISKYRYNVVLSPQELTKRVCATTLKEKFRKILDSGNVIAYADIENIAYEIARLEVENVFD